MKVASAGIQAQAGMPADKHAAAVMQAHDIDISLHRARQLNATMFSSHDLVLVMDNELKREVLSLHPRLRGRVHTLAEESIADPYQQPYDAFIDCYACIAEAVDAWQPRLHALIGPSERDI
jgi:protein-tyrosine phosphatase